MLHSFAKYCFLLLLSSSLIISCISSSRKIEKAKRHFSGVIINNSNDIQKVLSAFNNCFIRDTAGIRKLYADNAIVYDNMIPLTINKLIELCQPDNSTGIVSKLDSSYFIQEVQYNKPVRGFKTWVQIWGYRISVDSNNKVQKVAIHCDFALQEGKIIAEYDYYDPNVEFE
jgi:hypothetical protein